MDLFDYSHFTTIRAILEQLAAIAVETVLFCRYLTEVRVQAGLGWGQ